MLDITNKEVNIGKLERVAYQKARRAVEKSRKGKIVFVLIFVIVVALIAGFFIYNSYSKNEEPSEEYVNTNILVEGAIQDMNVLGAMHQEDIVEESNIPDEVNGFKVLGQIVMEKIDVTQNILSKTNSKSLQSGVTKFYGPKLNEAGNFCIAGHNWKSKLKRLNEMEIGDLFYIIDKETNSKVYYKIYDKYTCNPSDLSCLEQNEDGKREVTLITCNPGGLTRLICKAREV